MLSRGKVRSLKGGCADCGYSDPTWSSLNRGVLICDDCCSVHRSLGRHISQVKSLKRGYWHPEQLKMVHTLAANGANNIWEHSLLDPSHSKVSRERKPAPFDPVHPHKAEFVRCKYQSLLFVYRPGKDDRQLTAGDTSAQLHSSVRTANVETSLRLLSLSADVNYRHPLKGTCPLHVAARGGQSLQVELLLVYGADPTLADSDGHTAAQLARECGYEELAQRLDECQFELTDRLTYYVSGRRPDHAAGQRFVGLAAPPVSDATSQHLLAASLQLQNLPDRVLGELCADVYDEVDRRETDAHWRAQACCAATTIGASTAGVRRSTVSAGGGGGGVVPFLPVNPQFSSTRNQGRQKLARFSSGQFHQLVSHVVLECRRRHLGLPVSRAGDVSDDEPLYDSVPSEEDEQQDGGQGVDDDKGEGCVGGGGVVAACDSGVMWTVSPSRQQPGVNSESEGDFEISQSGGGLGSGQLSLANHSTPLTTPVGSDERIAVADASHMNSHTEYQLQQPMAEQVQQLREMVERLTTENAALRNDTLSPSSSSCRRRPPVPVPPPRPYSCLADASPTSHHRRHPEQQQPSSGAVTSPSAAAVTSPSAGAVTSSPQWQAGGRVGVWQRVSGEEGHYAVPMVSSPPPPPSPGSGSGSGSRSLPCHPSSAVAAASAISHLPSQEHVLHKTEQVTHSIQRLLMSAQSGNVASYSQCVQQIASSVDLLIAGFPEDILGETRLALQELNHSSWRLQNEAAALLCSSATYNINGSGGDTYSDSHSLTQRMIQLAFQVAKAAKHLVAMYQ